jgi:hypothetical protein
MMRKALDVVNDLDITGFKRKEPASVERICGFLPNRTSRLLESTLQSQYPRQLRGTP